MLLTPDETRAIEATMRQKMFPPPMPKAKQFTTASERLSAVIAGYNHSLDTLARFSGALPR